ncbi:MAG: hypothetical protein EU539_12355 [Promethearchaeota archaeon]|nr:MAG: hypothetical protein EU539_12355 [Candidatus Lokiarchaeota archaeon]
MIKKLNLKYTNNKMKEENSVEKDEEKSLTELKVKFFTEIKQQTRDLIDEIKEKEETTIGTIIDKAIHTYNQFKSISPETQALINKYEKEYHNFADLVEEAIKVLDENKNPEKASDLELWCRAREEMHMMLIGKTTFNQLLTAAEAPEESLDKPMKKNVALDVILWYTRKPIKRLTLEEIIRAIEKVWKVANYFYFIDVEEKEPDLFHVIFKHHQNKRYSNYWLGYFTELFQSEDLSFKCAIEGEAFDETLSLSIKKLHDKR